MVKCAECGFLAQHIYQGNVPIGFIDVEESPRETGELPGQLPFFGGFRSYSQPDLTPEKMSGDNYPTCFISKARTPCGLCRRDESPYIGWSVQMFQTPCALGTG